MRACTRMCEHVNVCLSACVYLCRCGSSACIRVCACAPVLSTGRVFCAVEFDLGVFVWAIFVLSTCVLFVCTCLCVLCDPVIIPRFVQPVRTCLLVLLVHACKCVFQCFNLHVCLWVSMRVLESARVCICVYVSVFECVRERLCGCG